MEWWWPLAIVAGIVAVFFGLVLLIFIWPLVLCWYLGHPIIGVFAEILYLAILR